MASGSRRDSGTSTVSCVKENDRTVWLLKESVRVSIQWLVTEIGTNGSLNKIDAHCGEGSSTGLSRVLCTEALRAFVLECLLQDTGCKQLWKMKGFPLGHREDVFAVQYNKDNVSLQGKGWTGVFTASTKKKKSDFLSLGFLGFDAKLLHAWNSPRDCWTPGRGQGGSGKQSDHEPYCEQ